MFLEKKIKSNDDYISVYAFLDISFPPVAWAVTRGVLVSSLNSSKKYNPGFVSFMLAGIIQCRNNSRYFNELIIESFRSQFYPSQSSRLVGMYFFQSKDDAVNRINDPNWPSYFIEDNLIELRLFSPTKPTVVDSNWITFSPLTDKGIIELNDNAWIKKYWSGVQYDDNPVWEIIADGLAIVPDFEIRKKCLELVVNYFPDSIIPITMARLAAEVGSNGGLITPFVHRISNDKIKLQYLWDDNDFHDAETIEKIKLHPDSGYLGKLMHENESWKSPDFSQWGIELELKHNESYENSNISNTSLHTIIKPNNIILVPS